MNKYYFKLNNLSPKYIQIYKNIKKFIDEDILIKNEKLIPIRQLAKILNVNTSTIVKSYDILESEGYIYKKLGSGCYVGEIKKFSKTKIKSDDIITFDLGTPSAEIFPVCEFKKAINMAIENEGPHLFDYDEGLGCEDLRHILCDYLKSISINSNPNRIQIISGAQQGIDIICKSILGYSDIVFTEEPTYNGAIEVFKSKGCKIIQIPILDDGIDIGILKLKLEKIRPKLMYVMPNFQNPTGVSYSTYKKKKLIELANEYDFYILEDDFLSDFKFYSNDTKTLKYYDHSDRVIYIKSFSKLLMPGLRIGFIDLPYEILHKVVLAKYSTDISTSTLVQKSLYYYIKYFNWKYHLKELEEIYKIRFDKTRHLIENNFKGKLDFKMPSGGINFFLGLPKGYSSIDFREYFIDKGVSVLPGNYFFDNPIEERFFRINVASTNENDIEKGFKIINQNLDNFIKLYKNKADFEIKKYF